MSSSRGLPAGTVISGKYKLVERLGGGGMGDVYRAEHQLAGRVVALKVLRSDLADNADVTRRFFQEAQAVNKIRHPNIVDVLDADLSPNGPYVVMECLEGASLAQALSRVGRLNLETALAVVLPMLDALDAAHRHGIVHRDLKPENVFLAVGDKRHVRVKLLDFGIAKVVSEAGGAQTNTGVIFGTPDYLSPEQATGDSAIDGRSDLFSVATVLFELLTGKRPWESSNPVATAYRIVHADAPTLASLGVVQPIVQRVLDIALSKERERRFGTAAAFADALAPLSPDGGTRREALRILLESVVGLSPTQAAPLHGDAPPSFSFEPSLPDVLAQSIPDTGAPAAPASAAAPAPASTSSPQAAKAYDASAPTLQSNEYLVPKAPAPTPARVAEPAAHPRDSRPDAVPTRGRLASQPEIRDRPSTPHATPSSGSGRVTPVASSRASSVTPGRTTTSPRPLTSSRPLPAAVKGKTHVRGTLPRAAAAWIERTHGKAARDEALSLLPGGEAELYRTGAFNALVWYDIETLHDFLEAATHVVLLDDATAWRGLARSDFDRDFAAIFRGAGLRDAKSALRRLPAGLSRLFDFGHARVDELSGNKVRVKLSDVEAASSPMRFMITGLVDGMLAGTPGLAVRISGGDASFAPELDLDVTWRDLAR